MTRELRRLVETARVLPEKVQRHGHDPIGSVEHVVSRTAHQRGERFRDRPSPVVLERVEDVTERTLVPTDRPPEGDHPFRTRAAVTPVIGIDVAPARQGIAADSAERTRRAWDRRPASRAHRAASGRVERARAARAARRENDRRERVSKGPNHQLNRGTSFPGPLHARSRGPRAPLRSRGSLAALATRMPQTAPSRQVPSLPRRASPAPR